MVPRRLAILLVILVTVFGSLMGCGRTLFTKGDGQPVRLVNNDYARDRPWGEVQEFLQRDETDQEPYSVERGSGYFAEVLHNRAEYHGFRTAFVVVEFEEGEQHALNAFNTVDYGLVYIDCTGRGAFDRNPPADIVIHYDTLLESNVPKLTTFIRLYHIADVVGSFPSHDNWDKIAYMVEGERIGFVGAGMTTTDFSYDWYKEKEVWDSPQKTDALWESFRRVVLIHNERFTIWFDRIWASLLPSEWDTDAELRSLLNERIRLSQSMNSLIEILKSGLPVYWKESDSAVTRIRIYW
jgi:hypothetical protein